MTSLTIRCDCCKTARRRRTHRRARYSGSCGRWALTRFTAAVPVPFSLFLFYGSIRCWSWPTARGAHGCSASSFIFWQQCLALLRRGSPLASSCLQFGVLFSVVAQTELRLETIMVRGPQHGLHGLVMAHRPCAHPHSYTMDHSAPRILCALRVLLSWVRAS